MNLFLLWLLDRPAYQMIKKIRWDIEIMDLADKIIETTTMSKTKNQVIDDLNAPTLPQDGKLYRITCTREALMLIANCVEDISRFSSGQPELSNTLMQMLSNCDDSCELRDEAEAHLQAAKQTLFPELPPGSSYSYNGGNQKNQLRKNLIGNTYQIYREILHQVALDENWNNVYTSESLPAGQLPKIQIEIINPKK